METEEKSKSSKILITIMLLITIIVAEFVFIVYQKQNINSLNNDISKLNEELNTTKNSIEILNNTINSSNKEIQEKLKFDVIEYMSSDTSVEDFIDTIYFYSNNLLETFDNINNASSKWIWEKVSDFAISYEYDNGISYEDINTIAKTMYGDNFTLEFPKEKVKAFGFKYDKSTEKYFIDYDYDYNYYSDDNDYNTEVCYYITNMNENNDEITEIEVIEYIIKAVEDDEGEYIAIELYDAENNLVKKYTGDIISSYEYTSGDIMEEIEKDIQNLEIDLKANKKIVVSLDNEGIYYIDSVAQI